MNVDVANYLQKIKLPDPDSHKGQNGKLLIIGGSQLFHAASKWSLDVASKFVDMLFYASVPSNNELIQQAKGAFWNGIVIDRHDIENYIQEADCILIGPGMTRDKKVSETWTNELLSIIDWELVKNTEEKNIARKLANKVLSKEQEKKLRGNIDWNEDTYAIINFLLARYPTKKFVIDAGALQMIEPLLLNENMIITPHYKELATIFDSLKVSINTWEKQHQGEFSDLEFAGSHFIGEKQQESRYHQWSLVDFDANWTGPESFNQNVNIPCAQDLSQELGGVTILLKGHADTITNGKEVIPIFGGHPGMTKGGTGDALAGLVAGLYTQNDAMTSAVVASYINKKSGEALAKNVGPFFNTSDLVQKIPEILWSEIAGVQAGK